MQDKLEKLSKRLDGLKNLLLLSKSGHLYLLKGYNVASVDIKRWFRQPETFKYISSMEFSDNAFNFYEYYDTVLLLRQVNNVIDDRNRYVTMLKSASHLGYTLRHKSQ